MTFLPRRLAAGSIALAMTVTLSACGGSGSSEIRLGGTQAASNTGLLERPWGQVKTFPELEKAEVPGPEDTSFAADMVMHHEQALELSENLLAHDDLEPRIAAAARFILKDQQNEIGVMTAWLEAWQASLGTGGHGHDGSSTMPGMLPQKQVDLVKTLDADEAQIHFLRSMLTHHEGAITMSTDYLPVRVNSFTYSTAQHIIREQGLEITYMTSLVDELCDDAPVASCPSA